MEKKICIITGANAGIGKQAAIQLAGRGLHVILACRSRERGESALKELKEFHPSGSAELRIVDMGIRESVRNFAREFSRDHDKLDILIHNAALFNITQKERMETDEGLETIWATNHIGPVLLTELLLEKLKNSSGGRVLTVSSKGLLAKPFLKVNMDDPEFRNRKFSVVNAYYQSKRAQTMYTGWLAGRLKETGVTVNCIQVTAVQIDITRHPELSPFMKKIYAIKSKRSLTPEKMAETYTWCALSDDVKGISGACFDESNRQIGSHGYSADPDNIGQVMRLTQKYIPELEV